MHEPNPLRQTRIRDSRRNPQPSYWCQTVFKIQELSKRSRVCPSTFLMTALRGCCKKRNSLMARPGRPLRRLPCELGRLPALRARQSAKECFTKCRVILLVLQKWKLQVGRVSRQFHLVPTTSWH